MVTPCLLSSSPRMDRGGLLPFQLWCPQPFGTYSQNQPRPPSTSLKSSACSEPGSGTETGPGPAHSENTPPALAMEAPAAHPAPFFSAAGAGDEGRVLLGTWYVIKPGNTKEKVAFFVAHQCGGGSWESSMKVKGHWGSDSSKAKWTHPCLESTKAPPDSGSREGPPAAVGGPVVDCSYDRLQQQSRRNKLRGRLETNRLFILLASLSDSNNSSNTPTTLLQPPQNGANPIPMSQAKSREIAEGGVVDEFIFFGKDGTQDEKEETMCLTVSPEEPPPPGQLFFLQSRGPDGPPEPPPTDAPTTLPGPDDAEGTADTSLCHLYRHVSHDFLEIRFKIKRLLELRQHMLLPPEHVLVKIFSFLPTRALVALKCTCHHFKGIIEAFSIRATDSRWSRDPLYCNDSCKQCSKRYEKGDVCRSAADTPSPTTTTCLTDHSYWMCCR